MILSFSKDYNREDAQEIFREMISVKISEDIDSIRIASKFSEFSFNELINKIETLINFDKYETYQ